MSRPCGVLAAVSATQPTCRCDTARVAAWCCELACVWGGGATTLCPAATCGCTSSIRTFCVGSRHRSTQPDCPAPTHLPTTTSWGPLHLCAGSVWGKRPYCYCNCKRVSNPSHTLCNPPLDTYWPGPVVLRQQATAQATTAHTSTPPPLHTPLRVL